MSSKVRILMTIVLMGIQLLLGVHAGCPVGRNTCRKERSKLIHLCRAKGNNTRTCWSANLTRWMTARNFSVAPTKPPHNRAARIPNAPQSTLGISCGTPHVDLRQTLPSKCSQDRANSPVDSSNSNYPAVSVTNPPATITTASPTVQAALGITKTSWGTRTIAACIVGHPRQFELCASSIAERLLIPLSKMTGATVDVYTWFPVENISNSKGGFSHIPGGATANKDNLRRLIQSTFHRNPFLRLKYQFIGEDGIAGSFPATLPLTDPRLPLDASQPRDQSGQPQIIRHYETSARIRACYRRALKGSPSASWFLRVRPDMWFFKRLPHHDLLSATSQSTGYFPRGIVGCHGSLVSSRGICLNDHAAILPRAYAAPYFDWLATHIDRLASSHKYPAPPEFLERNALQGKAGLPGRTWKDSKGREFARKGQDWYMDFYSVMVEQAGLPTLNTSVPWGYTLMRSHRADCRRTMFSTKKLSQGGCNRLEHEAQLCCRQLCRGREQKPEVSVAGRALPKCVFGECMQEVKRRLQTRHKQFWHYGGCLIK
mmetsp:Transcript_23762/g.51912  ORF Transcript_23762/g.51912 Transcript_23762/m.51912 type:complete len:543 (-) Transcript_23762:23-1651(-)